MLNLTEYQKRIAGRVEYLPWTDLVAPGVVLNKDGSYQRSFVYCGPDLESSTEAELVALTARFNTILKRFYSGWAMFFEAQRIPAHGYPAGQERRAQFGEQGAHFESRYLLTFVYLPPPEIADRTERICFELDGPSAEPDCARAHLDAFLTETDRAAEQMGVFLPELAPLDDVETLIYLHDTISTKQHVVAPPEVPIERDAFLGDTSLAGGRTLLLGEERLRALTMPGRPNTTTPGLHDKPNDLGLSYRWVTIDKVAANKQLGQLRQQKRKSDDAISREVKFHRETALVDTDADHKAIDADAALQELDADDVAFGHVTTSLVVSDRNQQAEDEKLLELERLLKGRGFTTIRETLGATEASLGSSPGNRYCQPIVHTLNHANVMPALWAGPSHNAYLNAPGLMLIKTNGTTPFMYPTPGLRYPAQVCEWLRTAVCSQRSHLPGMFRPSWPDVLAGASRPGRARNRISPPAGRSDRTSGHRTRAPTSAGYGFALGKNRLLGEVRPDAPAIDAPRSRSSVNDRISALKLHLAAPAQLLPVPSQVPVAKMAAHRLSRESGDTGSR